MNEELSDGFRLKNWEIWPLRDLLRGPDGEHHVEPKAMQVLVALARQPGEVVTRESLLEEVWPDTYSGEVSLTRCISLLRHEFSDKRENSEFIETIPKIGYRLVAQVEPFVDTRSRDPIKSMTWVTVAIAVLFLGLSYLVYDRLFLEPERHTVTVQGFVPEENSIAVLPFVNVSDDPGNEYFSDGISEDILNLLTKVPALQVTSRRSAFSLKGQNLDVPTIAGKLNVAHVLEGTVRKSGGQLRITAQLINAKTDKNLWSETYDRELRNVFAIQDDIAAAVVDALEITLLDKGPKATGTDPEAYALYLQGRHFRSQASAVNLKQAETLLVQALAIDSGFAPAWTELGFVYLTDAMAEQTLWPLDDGMEAAREAIQKALAIDPQYGLAHAALALVEMFYDWDFKTAFMHQQQALTLNSGDAVILRIAGRLNTKLGRLDEAIELHRQSIALDPISFIGHYRLGRALYYSHRLGEAADALQMALSLNPSGYGVRYYLGRVLLSQGDASAALTLMEQETLLAFRFSGMAIVQHALGDAVASNAALQESIETGGAYQVAQVYAFRNEIDNAFKWLDHAYAERDPAMTNLLLSPELANLHDDPRWEPLLDKMGLPH